MRSREGSMNTLGSLMPSCLSEVPFFLSPPGELPFLSSISYVYPDLSLLSAFIHQKGLNMCLL